MRTAGRFTTNQPTVLLAVDLRRQTAVNSPRRGEFRHEPTSETHQRVPGARHGWCAVVKNDDPPLPPAVTFKSGAELLMQLGIVDRISHQGVRYIAESDDWPFGEDREHPYWTVANATVMETEPFLEYFRKRERNRRNGT